MTIEQLLTLKQIQQTGSFRAASQSMNKAQSAVSYAIRSLESEIGFSLFTRDKYRPELTPQGRAFLKKADELMAQLDDLKTTADFLQRGHEPQIRLAVSALFPLPLLTECLKSFQQKYPRTEIRILHDVLSADEQLLDGQADLAFGELLNETQLLRTKEITRVTLRPVCTPNFLKQQLKGKKIKAELIYPLPQIVLASTGKDRSRSAAIFSSNQMVVDDLESKKQFLLAGLGWGFMPEFMIRNELKNKSLVFTHSEEIKISLSMAHPKKSELGPCAQHIWRHFNNSL